MTDEAPPPPRPRRRKPSVGKTIRTWLGRAVGALLLVGLVALGWLAYRPRPPAVDVAEVKLAPMRVTVEEDGRTRVKERFTVSAPIAGNLARIELHAGDRVKKGATVARILPAASPLLDPRSKDQAEGRVLVSSAARKQAESSVERAKVAKAFADKELVRIRDLAKAGSLPELDLERAELEARSRASELASAEISVQVSDNELKMARAALARHDKKGAEAEAPFLVTAPVDGIVLRVVQESEGVVQPGMPLLDMGDPAALEVVVDVLTSDAVVIAPGAHAQIERWGGPKPLEARVRLVEPSAFQRVSALGVAEQRVNVLLDIVSPRAEWSALGDGFRTFVRVTVWEAPEVLTIPENALFRVGDKWAVYVLDAKPGAPVLERREVQIGRRNGALAEIKAGLAAAERIVIHPSERLLPGMRVEVR